MKQKGLRNRKSSRENEAPAVTKPRLAEMLEIPAAAVLGAAQMEITGNREVVIDGCKGVLAYDDNIIRMAVEGMILTFNGRNLQIKVLTHSSAIIDGFITGIEFST